MASNYRTHDIFCQWQLPGGEDGTCILLQTDDYPAYSPLTMMFSLVNQDRSIVSFSMTSTLSCVKFTIATHAGGQGKLCKGVGSLASSDPSFSPHPSKPLYYTGNTFRIFHLPPS